MHPFRDAAFKTVSSEAEDSVLLVLATGAEPLATRLLVVGAELSIKLLEEVGLVEGLEEFAVGEPVVGA